MKRNDFILASAMLIIALVWFLVTNIFSEKGEMVFVTVDNKITEEISLSQEGRYSVEGYNGGSLVFEIKDNKVSVISSTCPDKLCVYQKPAGNDSEVIVCLPNKIELNIKTDDNYPEGDYDAISY